MLTATIRSRVEPELKEDAGKILKACGLDLSTAIRLFLNRVVIAQGLPFEVVPNEKTIAALEEGRRISARFKTPDELFSELEGINASEKKAQGKRSVRARGK